METIRINCEPNIKSKILEFLGTFSSNDYKVLNEDAEFFNQKKKLEASLEKIKNSTAETCSLEELEAFLDKTISEYEN